MKNETPFRLELGPPELVKRMDEAGVCIQLFTWVVIPSANGEVTIDMTDMRQAERYLRNPRGFAATYWRISTMDLDLWEAEGTIPRCAARARSGRPCRNQVHPACDPHEFYRYHRQFYCHVHGDGGLG